MNSHGSFSSPGSNFQSLIRKTFTRPGSRLSPGHTKILKTWSLLARSLWSPVVTQIFNEMMGADELCEFQECSFLSFFFLILNPFGLAMWHVGLQFPDQGLNLHPLEVEMWGFNW